MVDVKKYIIDGEVKRDRIVADIKRRRISAVEITELDKNEKIRSAYFGGEYIYKKSKDKWNGDYLDRLSLVSVSEAFNKEYMLFLNEVAEFVANKDKKKENTNKAVRAILCVIIVALLIAAAIMFFTAKAKMNRVALSVSTIALTQNTYLCLVKILS